MSKVIVAIFMTLHFQLYLLFTFKLQGTLALTRVKYLPWIVRHPAFVSVWTAAQYCGIWSAPRRRNPGVCRRPSLYLTLSFCYFGEKDNRPALGFCNAFWKCCVRTGEIKSVLPQPVYRFIAFSLTISNACLVQITNMIFVAVPKTIYWPLYGKKSNLLLKKTYVQETVSWNTCMTEKENTPFSNFTVYPSLIPLLSPSPHFKAIW